VSKVRPEAWWSYYSQDYKGPNGLSLQRYPKNYGKRVKDKTDQDSWFSAKPIIVGSLSNILVGTELNLIQKVNYHVYLCEIHFLFVYIGGSWRFYRWVCRLGMTKMDLELSDIEW
jgi:hypothetical protein